MTKPALLCVISICILLLPTVLTDLPSPLATIQHSTRHRPAPRHAMPGQALLPCLTPHCPDPCCSILPQTDDSGAYRQMDERHGANLRPGKPPSFYNQIPPHLRSGQSSNVGVHHSCPSVGLARDQWCFEASCMLLRTTSTLSLAHVCHLWPPAVPPPIVISPSTGGIPIGLSSNMCRPPSPCSPGAQADTVSALQLPCL